MFVRLSPTSVCSVWIKKLIFYHALVSISMNFAFSGSSVWNLLSMKTCSSLTVLRKMCEKFSETIKYWSDILITTLIKLTLMFRPPYTFWNRIYIRVSAYCWLGSDMNVKMAVFQLFKCLILHRTSMNLWFFQILDAASVLFWFFGCCFVLPFFFFKLLPCVCVVLVIKCVGLWRSFYQ